MSGSRTNHIQLRPIMKKTIQTLTVLLLALQALAASAAIQKGEMAGYLLVPNERVPETYNAGFSMYVAAWPLLDQYPGQRFQTGLFGTWMFARKDPPPPIKLYSDIEGGLARHFHIVEFRREHG